MGTLKQASTLIALEGRYRRRHGMPPMSADDEKDARARILAADLATVRKYFDKVNALLQFDRRSSPATAEQLGVLGRWEQRAGLPRTTPADGLSFEEAHRRIESLKVAS